MKTNILILCFLVVFSSCKKDLLDQFTDDFRTSTPKPTLDLSRLVKKLSYIETNGDTTLWGNFSYDGSGRVSRIWADGRDERYTYYSNYYTVIGKLSSSVFFLSGGKVDSVVTAFPTDTTSEKYIKDAQNQLVTIKKYSIRNGKSTLTTTATNTYSDGNITKLEYSTINYTTYTYTSYLYQYNMGMPYLFYNKNYPATEMAYSRNGQRLYTYTYEFDSLGRITRKTYRAASGILSDEIYAY